MATVAELFDLALLHHQNGRPDQAEFLCRQILESDPSQPAVYHLLGILAKEAGREQDAVVLIERAIALNPKIAGFHFNLGLIHQSLGQWTESERCFRSALALDAHLPRGWRNLGVALSQQGKSAEAADAFRQALISNPNDVDALNNLGLILVEQRQLGEAAECYRQALAIDPENKPVLLNRGLLRLLQGDFENGWRDFENRSAGPGENERLPIWDGSSLHGKTILVVAEQGLGDCVMFGRFLPLVKERGARVVVKCPSALARVLGSIEGVDQVVISGEPLPAFDVQIGLLSLPFLLQTTFACLPNRVPYITADAEKVKRWQTVLAGGTALNVGIVWQGNPLNSMDRLRSVPLRHFEALVQVEGVRLISLQVGPGREQLGTVPFHVEDVSGRFESPALDDLAAALMNVDLLVTVCTSAAHVAGALGVPTWVALSTASDWRWLLERSDSPWYPTVRLFRQTAPGDWESVFAQMATALEPLSVAASTRRDGCEVRR